MKTHLGHMLDKLGLRDRVQAVVFGYEHGLVEPGAGRGSPRQQEIQIARGALLTLEEGSGNGHSPTGEHRPEHDH